MQKPSDNAIPNPERVKYKSPGNALGNDAPGDRAYSPVLKSELHKAPKVRNMTAQGNALGTTPPVIEPRMGAK
jgi:hypothetical protein